MEEKRVHRLEDLPKVGVYFGKFIPPHRGHLTAILTAATKVQKLYVVVSDNVNRTKRICQESGIPEVTVNLRMQWLKQELQDMPNSYSHTIYKQYVDMLKNEEQSQAHASEQMMEELEDQIK